MTTANELIYEVASIIHDDPDTAPILIEELVNMLLMKTHSRQQLNELEDVIVNQFGVEVHGEETV